MHESLTLSECNTHLCRIVSWAIVLSMLVALSGRISFAEPNHGELFQAYPLRHVSAREAKAQLTKALKGLPEKIEVSVDETNQRLFVRGSARMQQWVTQTLGLLDQAEVRKSQDPILKAYPISGGNPKAIAAGLQSQYVSDPRVRIAADMRKSQILVLAPPELQTDIARRLTGSRPKPSLVPAAQRPIQQKTVQANPQSPLQPPAQIKPQNSAGNVVAQSGTKSQVHAAPTRSPTGTIQLRHLKPFEFEEALQKLWRRPIPVTTRQESDVAIYTLKHRDGSRGQLFVNRRTGEITVQVSPQLFGQWAKLIAALDSPRRDGDRLTKLVSLKNSQIDSVRKALMAMAQDVASGAKSPAQDSSSKKPTLLQKKVPLVALLFQPQKKEQEGAKKQAGAPDKAPPDKVPPANVPVDLEAGSLIGPVRIEFLLDDIIVIIGHERDVALIKRIIAEIERLSAVTKPVIKVVQLKHVDNESLATIILEIYEQVLAPRQGRVSITPLVKPNALLLIGRKESIESVLELIEKLDTPVGPKSQSVVFRLKYISAANAQTAITDFFADRAPLGTKVKVTADARSNSIVVYARPRDMAEVRLLVKRIDVARSNSVNELRVFTLQNSLATDMAQILQSAIDANVTTGAAAPTTGQAQSTPSTQGRTTMLRFLTGTRQLTSGILTDVRITADVRANALIVSAPRESMELIAVLIQQLDQMPNAEAQIKVFSISNGDAIRIQEMLESLFGQQTTTGQGGLLGPGASATESQIPLRFSVEQQTNSIIAIGNASDLVVIEALIARLDSSEILNRKMLVYHLKYASAEAVANAVNDYLQQRLQRIQRTLGGAIPMNEQIEREVVVAPEIVSNRLIISATEPLFSRIRKVVEDLDAKPPSVLIQLVIAEVSLNSTDEFGVEFGIQDSLLFDRSVIGATLDPGFIFNNNPLGNAGSAGSLATSNNTAGQGLSNFAMGRINSELGFGGLVLSASSESISAILRALKENRRVEILSRPQIMMLDNQPGAISIGESVPQITQSSVSQVGGQTTNSIEYRDVGLLLSVIPRISPDGLVEMEINVEKSDLGPEAEGIPISFSGNNVIRAPRINLTQAKTTISAMDGQTVVLGGLITKLTSEVTRQVPFLGSLPLVGKLFRYDQLIEKRTELLIIMTPHIVRNEKDAEWIKQIESSRMSWCLADVYDLHGPAGLSSRFTDGQSMIIYPDEDPAADKARSLLKQQDATPSPTEPLPSPTPELPPNTQHFNHQKEKALDSVRLRPATPVNRASYYEFVPQQRGPYRADKDFLRRLPPVTTP